MTHAPFIPLREAKNRDVRCQGEFKVNLSALSTGRTRKQQQRGEEMLEVTHFGG